MVDAIDLATLHPKAIRWALMMIKRAGSSEELTCGISPRIVLSLKRGGLLGKGEG